MLEKLKILQERFNELSKMLIQPDIISDQLIASESVVKVVDLFKYGFYLKVK